MTAIIEMDAGLVSAGRPSAQNSATQTEPAHGADFMAALSDLSGGDEPNVDKLTHTPIETALPATGKLDLTVETDQTIRGSDPERAIAAQTQATPSEPERIAALRPDEVTAEPDTRHIPAASGETRSAGNEIAADIRRAATAADTPAQIAVSDATERKTAPAATQPLAPGLKPDVAPQPNRSAGVTGDVRALGPSGDGITEGAILKDAGSQPTEGDLVQAKAASDRASPETDLPAIPAAKAANADATAKAPGAFGSSMTADAVLTPDAVPTGTQSLVATPAAASAPAPITLSPSAAVAPNQVLVTAAPADVPSVISQSLASEAERPDRIIVQLDPPELGRVSIDFKFDAQGLQHVTISGESPEALRQLRLMHFELIQTLERQGLTGQDMSFKQHASSHQHQHWNQEPHAPETAAETPSVPVQPTLHRAILPTDLTAGGLDIRL